MWYPPPSNNETCDNNNINKSAESGTTIIVDENKSRLRQCVDRGRTFNLDGGAVTFCSITKSSLQTIECADYTIILTAQLTELDTVPTHIKPLLQHRWHYSIHVNQTQTPIVNIDVLKARNTGGEIVAFKCTEFSIDGHNSIYYGFIPTMSNFITPQMNTHRVCRVTCVEMWPRKLYIYLEYVPQSNVVCLCEPTKCASFWSVRLADYTTTQTYCLKTIPWGNLYVIMGSQEESYCDLVNVEVARNCAVCAQCYECSKNITYCRKHRKCKHKKATVFNIQLLQQAAKGLISDAIIPKDSKIKACIKYK